MASIELIPGQWTNISWIDGDMAVEATHGPIFLDTAGTIDLADALQAIPLKLGQAVVVANDLAVTGNVRATPATARNTLINVNPI